LPETHGRRGQAYDSVEGHKPVVLETLGGQQDWPIWQIQQEDEREPIKEGESLKGRRGGTRVDHLSSAGPMHFHSWNANPFRKGTVGRRRG